MSERDRLYQDIMDNPDDDLPRLIYADWLEEYGNELERLRGTYIKAAVAIHALAWKSRSDEDQARYEEATVIKRNTPPAAKDVAIPDAVKGAVSIRMRRGFPFLLKIERESLSTSRFSNMIKHFCQNYPIQMLDWANKEPREMATWTPKIESLMLNFRTSWWQRIHGVYLASLAFEASYTRDWEALALLVKGKSYVSLARKRIRSLSWVPWTANDLSQIFDVPCKDGDTMYPYGIFMGHYDISQEPSLLEWFYQRDIKVFLSEHFGFLHKVALASTGYFLTYTPRAEVYAKTGGADLQQGIED